MSEEVKPVEEALERVAEAVVEQLGFELVDLDQAGHPGRPLLRLRIDRPDAKPGLGVTVDDCARVSRELEAVLEGREDVPSTYILEVSSPGIERPLRKRRDFERYVGHEVALRGHEPLAAGSRRLEGILLGVEDSEDGDRLRLRLANRTEVEVPRSAVASAKLIFRWDPPRGGKRRGRKTRKKKRVR